MYTVGTGFSGIGVPDLVAEMLGMKTVWQIEKDAFCQQVLRKHFPAAALYGDIFDAHDLPHVDCAVFGFPCQPFSVAGRRQGERDDRYLVPEMLRVIDETRPRVLLLENVPGFASLDHGNTFKRLLRALAEMGLDAEWGHIRASDFGAPHQRERWWLVAYADGGRRKRADSWRGDSVPDQYRNGTAQKRGRHEFEFGTGANGQLGYSAGARLEGRKRAQRQGRGNRPAAHGSAKTGRVSQSRLGRVIDGSTYRVDGFTPYPARPGEPQYPFEPPRLTSRKSNRKTRLHALGNTMAVDVVYAIMQSIHAWLQAVDAQAESEKVA